MIKRVQGIVFFAFFLSSGLYSQDVKEAHVVVDTLSSKYFWGRGYVNDGHHKSAEYLAGKFKECGLMPLSETYFQEYDFRVNVFESNILLKSKAIFTTGVDFIPSADNPAFKGKLKVRSYDSTKKYSSKDIVILDKKPKNFEGNYITFSNKLTHTYSQSQSSHLGFHLLDSAKVKLGKKLKVDLHPVLRNVKAKNVIGYVKGSVAPDTFLVICAHYDHLGGIGSQCYFPGANDNASGVAMLLQLASYYTHTLHQPKYSIIFIAFGGEEAGLVGSQYYVEHPLVPLSATKFVTNLDLMGSGLEGITVVNGTVFTKEFEQLKTINANKEYIKIIKSRGRAANSDHYYFSENGVKSFFIYSLGEVTAYHDIYDVAKKVPLTKFPEMYNLIIDFINKL